MGRRLPAMTTASLYSSVRYRHHDESIFLYAFDLIELNGDDLRPDPLEGRKATLDSTCFLPAKFDARKACHIASSDCSRSRSAAKAERIRQLYRKVAERASGA